MSDMKHLEKVQEYYGETLESSQDLQTTACCTAEAIPEHLKPIFSAIHPEILGRFYGCGSPLPLALEDCTVLDLGCGTGRDCYTASKLVGENGRVIGIDMTDEQLDVAKKHIAYHTDKFGYKEPNVQFLKGQIEDLKSAGIDSNSVDVVTSNCVLNLSPDKEQVLKEVFRVLKPGGELYFSDVYTDRRLPKEMAEDKVLLGECLGGALYVEDFRRILARIGCLDYRMMSSAPIEITNKKILEQLGPAKFSSITIRAFKLDLEDRCEDYGQVAYYNGTIPYAPHTFMLDDHHIFEKNRPMLVCSNTADMVQSTRLKKHFRVEGNTSTHYGLFDCGPETVSIMSDDKDIGGACC